jgi:hypothetical protein
MEMLLVLGGKTLPATVFSFKSHFGDIDPDLLTRGKADISRA